MNNVPHFQLAGAAALLLSASLAHADPCKLTLQSNDQMQFSARELAVPAECTEVEVTLTHSGKLPATAMGHDWVLAKDSDMSAVINAGMAAGPSHGYLPQHDPRIIAATKIVGGGESATVKFPTSLLQTGTHYTFFCTTPGHATIMRGRFHFTTGPVTASNSKPDSHRD
jgi:azurin